ncbi:amidohydrolase family protein [Variovorax sp. Sphag1AA]|uniref:metal-dependent hydrolase family protein n=1 Tax=Variovorax sp. Sphag1AA TaxID=2587027 RepID=UPI00182FC8FE|nr:amidohydrolase family protein [Variovorax sp. Sphag1AA]MBB3178542.1 imidazolonepropionase-like amidohydrolase [Variovorax sp. Sphag1AA]
MYACSSLTGDTVIRRAVCLCHRPELHSLTRRINAELTRRGFVAGMAASVASVAALGFPLKAKAQTPEQPKSTLFTNVRIFDGRSAQLRDGHLLVEGNRIKSIGAGTPATPAGAQLIDCKGRVMMPGLIDAHWHSLFAALPLPVLLQGNIGYIHLAGSAEAERTLLRGFTTVRDLGGPTFAFKQAIDEGLIAGPRIYPCGAMITGSGGHGDLRPLSDVPRTPGVPSFTERTGAAAIVDGPDEIRLRVREQLTQGASQVKIVGGGGVSSPRTPLDLTTLSEAEVRAAAEVARDWNTYITVHAYASNTVQRAINAGAGCVEHAHLMDDATARLMADKGVWLSTQPFLSDEDTGRLTGQGAISAQQVFGATDGLYKLAKKYKIKTAFGSDMLFSPALAQRQGIMLTHLTRWFSNSEILTMATSTNAQLMALSGPRNPYPGKLGVLEEGAYADLLLVDGNPLDNIALLATPDTSLMIVMKDGKIHKNTLKA